MLLLAKYQQYFICLILDNFLLTKSDKQPNGFEAEFFNCIPMLEINCSISPRVTH